MGLDDFLTQSDLFRIVSLRIQRSPRYVGMLAKPLPIQVGHLLPVERPHWYAGTDNDWKSEVARIIEREDQEWFARVGALAEHYGVQLDKKLLDLDNRWQHLALRLAQAHVPAFRFDLADSNPRSARRGAAPVMTDKQIFCLGAFLCRALKSGISRDDIPRLARAILETNNQEKLVILPARKGAAQKPIGRPTASRLIEEMLSAWSSVKDGTANAFQYRVVRLALLCGDWPDCREFWSLIFNEPGKARPAMPERLAGVCHARRRQRA